MEKIPIIPWTDFFIGEEFIYNGTEEIPFKDRDPEYQKILTQEFLPVKKLVSMERMKEIVEEMKI